MTDTETYVILFIAFIIILFPLYFIISLYWRAYNFFGKWNDIGDRVNYILDQEKYKNK